MRVAIFGDLFHIPEWRLCAVVGCPEVLQHPNWICLRHMQMGTWGSSRGRDA